MKLERRGRRQRQKSGLTGRFAGEIIGTVALAAAKNPGRRSLPVI